MEFFKSHTNIDFLGIRKLAAVFSVIIFIASLIAFFGYGLNLGLDFTGGTQIELAFDQPIDVNIVRDQLHTAGFTEAAVQTFGHSQSVLVTLPMHQLRAEMTEAQKTDQRTQQVNAVLKSLEGATLNRVDFIGAKVSSELAHKGILAVIIAIIITMIYIAVRFERRLAISAAVSLIHDPILILGVFAFFRIPFDLTSLAAVLTILGYSLNDSIVVFDRIRENFRRMRKGSPIEIVNSSINQTLSRTIITSGLTLLAVVVLFALGGPSIHAFSLALIIGIVIGTYSSIYVAGSLAVSLGLNRSDLLQSVKRDYDAIV